jgi:hypothetical protein
VNAARPAWVCPWCRTYLVLVAAMLCKAEGVVAQVYVAEGRKQSCRDVVLCVHLQTPAAVVLHFAPQLLRTPVRCL